MKLVILILILATSNTLIANPVKRSNLSPIVDQPLVPGTRLPLKELNTAPAPTPSANASKKFRGTLKGSPDFETDKKEEQQVRKQKSGKK